METIGTGAVVLPGHLYVVATPIGNLGDLSPRARATLAQVDRICAEDTRNTGLLLKAHGIDRPMTALHDHNEDRVAATLVDSLLKGQSLALVSDAGTPLISDPGFALVRAAREAGCEIITVPGPCALIAALSISGIGSDSFTFVGFLPARVGARRQKLESLSRESRAVIFYESSHRIVDCLEDLAAVFEPERKICIARELTKRYEQSVTLPVSEAVSWVRADDNRQKGEFVVVIEAGAGAEPGEEEARKLLKVLLQELPPARAARVVTELCGLGRKQVYALATQMGSSTDR